MESVETFGFVLVNSNLALFALLCFALTALFYFDGFVCLACFVVLFQLGLKFARLFFWY